MIDFHMHVLPAMDDGSPDEATSLAMMETTAAYGVDTIAATSHFYGEDNSPTEFLARRQRAYDRLMNAVQGRGGLPQVRLGAEVRFFSGISGMEELGKLCLEGTDLLLLEMPFVPWTDRMLREVESIAGRGLTPVAAHVERYMDIQDRKTMGRFMDMPILIQCNASFFVRRKTSRKALKLLKERRIHFLGSDAHNMTLRAPNLGEALELVERRLGPSALDHLQAYQELAMEGSRLYL
jgi:protein-tyrosine phosphatase